MENQIGGGSLNLEILRGGRAYAVLEFKVEGGGGGQKNVPSVMGIAISSQHHCLNLKHDIVNFA